MTGPAGLRTFILGEFRVGVDGLDPVSLPAMPAQILALLVLHVGNAVPTSRIIEEIWAPEPPARAAARLHVHISRIRSALARIGSADVMHTRNDGYALDLDPRQCDHREFEDRATAGLEAAVRGELRRAAELLSAALALWRGPVLGDFGDLGWARADAARLTGLRKQAVDTWAEVRLGLGEPTAVVDVLQRELTDDPLRESTAELLMTALYRSGRQADALNTYVRTRAELSDELGLDPSPALHETYLSILRQEATLAPPAPAAATARLAVDLPVRATALVGRERELAVVEAEIEASAEQPRVVALVGMGGVGKTRLAIEVAHRDASTGGSIAWWVPTGDTASAVDALERLARALGIADQADQTIVLARLWEELRRRPGWLLVYDDCQGPETFAAIRPPSGDGTVLVTTRHRGWGRIGRQVAVDVLDDASAVQLLTSVSGDTDVDAAKAAAAPMAGLPLALIQAAAYVDQTGMSLAHYAELLRDRLLPLLSRGAPDDHSVSVSATWDMSLDTIAARDPAAAQLLVLCTVLGPARVPIEMLEAAGPLVDEPLREVVTDPLRREDTIAELLRFSLVMRYRDGLRVHPLLRAVLGARLTDAERESVRRRAARIVTALTPRDPEDPATWPRWAGWVPHALDMAARLQAIGDHEQAGELRFAASRYLAARALFPSAQEAAESALASAGDAWEPRDPRRVPITTHLGLIRERRGDLASARALQEDALVLLRAAGQAGTTAEARTLMHLGAVLACQRDLVPARAAFEEALVLFERSGTAAETGRCLTELALVEWMAALLERARETFERAIALLDGSCGPAHPDAAHARSGLAVVLQDLGEVRAAHRLQSDATQALVEALGEAHPEVAHAYDRLAYQSGLLGDRRAGIDGHTKAMKILRDVHGPDHVELGMPLTNLGVLHLGEGELELAAAAQEQARALFAAGYGPHHPHTALATRRLGVVRHAQRRFEEAEALLLAAQRDTVAGLGADHPDAAAIRDELAALQSSRCGT